MTKTTTKTKDPIRELLASLPPAMFLGNPPGTVAIWRAKIVEAGGDPDAVLAWVRERGGHLDRSFPPSPRKGLRVGRQAEPRQFYVIPENALS